MSRMLGLLTGFLLCPVAGYAACSVSASGVSFGTYNPLAGSATKFSGSVTFTCTSGSGTGPYTISLSTGGGGTFAGRRMTSGVYSLPYQLYLDAAYSQIWGDSTGGSSVYTGSDNAPVGGGGFSIPIFGQILPRSAAAPGSYTDTIIATISY